MKYFMSPPPCFPPESFLALPYCYVQLWSLFSNPLLQLSFFLSHLFSRSFQIRTCDPMETADWAGRWGALTQAGLPENSVLSLREAVILFLGAWSVTCIWEAVGNYVA